MTRSLPTLSHRAEPGERAYQRDTDGYLPIEAYAAIGNGRTIALVGSDGSIDWAPFARIDRPTVFARLLDARKGGYWQIAPEEPWTATRRYLEDTNVLVTEFTTASGVVELIDLMPSMAFGSGLSLTQALWDGMLLRFVRGVQGNVRLRQVIAPAFNYAQAVTMSEVLPGRGAVLCSDSAALRVSCAMPLERRDGGVEGTFEIAAGEQRHVSASFHASGAVVWADLPAEQANDLLERDIDGWRRWVAGCEYDGPYAAVVRRSALVLKLLDYLPSGAMVAAATTSLPERLGGVRNWDYRYSWIRDTSYALHALMSIGFRDEAEGFLQWVIDATKDDPAALQIMYRVDGGQDLVEQELTHLEGYKGSRPVRIGNAAFAQDQLDRFGEVVDACYIHRRFGGVMNESLWDYIVALVDQVLAKWRQPDSGIWEVRSEPRRMTYSNVACWIALDRGIKMAEMDGRQPALDRWRAERERIRRDVLTLGVSPKGYFTQSFGHDVLDASALTFPIRGFIDADHPIMRATIAAVERDLTRDGLVARYRVADAAENVDGLPGDEGRFVLCSCWLVDCLTRLGELDRAQALLESVLARANDVGLFSEEIDSDNGAFLGNFPQGFSHLGIINSIINLGRARGDVRHVPDAPSRDTAPVGDATRERVQERTADDA